MPSENRRQFSSLQPTKTLTGWSVESVCHPGIFGCGFRDLSFSCSFPMTVTPSSVVVSWWELNESPFAEPPSKPFFFPAPGSSPSHLGGTLHHCVQAAIRKDHRLSDFNNNFVIILEAGSPQSRGRQVWLLQRPLPLVCRLPPCPSVLTLPFLYMWVPLPLLKRTPVLLD